VNEVNRPPDLSPLSNRAVDEGQTLTVEVSASDPDLPANSLLFALSSTAPFGATINPTTGRISWTPTEAQGPSSYEFQVRVSDNGTPSLSDTATFTVTVNEVNSSPVLAPIADQSFAELAALSLTASATDPDLPLNSLLFALSSVPTGASINPETGLITWTPNEQQGPGFYPFTVRVTDNGSPALSDETTFTVAVGEVNQPPVLAFIPDQVINELATLSFTASATDPDLPPNSLLFALGSSAPSGATIDPTTGLFSWTPTETQGPAQYDVTVEVTDNGDAIASGNPRLRDLQVVRITVLEVNRPPILTPIGDRTIDELQTLSLQATASDPDLPANMLQFELVSGPAGASISTSGMFSWTPSELQGPGSYPLTIKVTDNGLPALSDQTSFTITVDEVNLAPQITPVAPQTIDEETTLSFTVTASDPDSPPNGLSFSLEGAPPGASINSQTGLFSWTPDESQGTGQYSVIVKVTDDRQPALSDQTTVAITVNEVNRPPVLAPIADQAAGVNQLVTFTATATDPDLPPNSLLFALSSSAPNGASIDAMTGVFTWTPTQDQAGQSYPLTVQVTDNGTPPLSDSESFTIDVAPCPFHDDLQGWTAGQSGGSTNPGSVVGQDCSAVLTEGDSFVVFLEQDFLIPTTPSAIQFTYADLAFDTTDPDFINDAFEVALVEEFGNSLVKTVEAGRDSFFNVSEDVGQLAADGIIVVGQAVTVGLNGLPVGTPATIIFRLANNDTDETTTVRVTDVRLVASDLAAAPPGGPSSGTRGALMQAVGAAFNTSPTTSPQDDARGISSAQAFLQWRTVDAVSPTLVTDPNDPRSWQGATVGTFAQLLLGANTPQAVRKLSTGKSWILASLT